MNYRSSFVAFLVALLVLTGGVLLQSAAGQQTVPGKIIPDLDPETAESETVDDDRQEDDAEQEVARQEEATDESADQEDDEASTDEDSVQEQVNTTGVSLDFLYDGSLPESISQMVAMEGHVAELTERCKKATVNIQVEGAQGSGVVVSRDGYILTAAHVISRPRLSAIVTFPDGSTVNARTLGVHHSGIDSGMLKIVDEGRWPYLDMGESETLAEGQWVAAIGHPGGFDDARGLVLRIGRLIAKSDEVLQTDCTLVGGDSGGPLLDMDGNVIGIHSRIGQTLADNYHVPVDVFSNEWDQLAAGVSIGARARPWVGLALEEETNVVETVDPDGPAGKAGLESGDTIIEGNESDIEDKSDFAKLMAKLRPEMELKLKVKRGDEELEFEFEIGQR